jgi:hypothetical protein
MFKKSFQNIFSVGKVVCLARIGPVGARISTCCSLGLICVAPGTGFCTPPPLKREKFAATNIFSIFSEDGIRFTAAGYLACHCKKKN